MKVLKNEVRPDVDAWDCVVVGASEGRPDLGRPACAVLLLPSLLLAAARTESTGSGGIEPGRFSSGEPIEYARAVLSCSPS